MRESHRLRARRAGRSWRRGAAALLCAATLAGVAAPAGSDPGPVGSPIPSFAAMSDFRARDGFRVGGWAGTGVDLAVNGADEICVGTRRVTSRRGVRTIYDVWGCANDGTGNTVDYRFNPATWEARATGAVRTIRAIEVARKRSGTWRTESYTVRPWSTATFDITWRGTGNPEPHYAYGVLLPIGCYWPPGCLPYAHAWMTRAAEVSGRIVFKGLKLDARLPRNARGVISLPG